MTRCRVLWVLAVLCLEVRLSAAQSCRFPDHLTSRSRWETRITMERKRVQTFVKFHGRTMEQIDFGPLGESHVTQECVQSTADDKFLLRRSSQDTGLVDYFCLQVVRRSDSIIQFRQSQGEEFPSMLLCEDSRMQLNPWPLVWPNSSPTPGQTGSCGIEGGFDFYLHDAKDNDPLCAESWLRPRLEVDCMAGDGLSMDFRTYECRGDLKVAMDQHLDCLGSWRDDDYSYTVLTDSGDLWPRLWMLRFPINKATTFDGFLSGDIVADTSENLVLARNFYRMTAKRSDYPSVCENEALGCKEECDGYNDFYCQKSCNRCDERDAPKDCTFSDEWRGDWEERSHWGRRDITVATSVLYADGLSPFECLKLPYSASDFEDPIPGGSSSSHQRVAMVTVYRNGCKPRYTCVQFRKRGENVMQYRISQHLVWPHALNIAAEDICTANIFAVDTGPLRDQYRSQDFKILLRKSMLNNPLPTTRCGFQGVFSARATYAGGTSCSATLESCYEDDRFSLTHDGCHDEADHVESFRCVASFSEGGSQVIVTQREDDPRLTHCWVMHLFDDVREWVMYKLESADCNLNTAHSIRHNNATRHLSQLSIDADINRGMNDVAGCWQTVPGNRPPKRPTTHRVPRPPPFTSKPPPPRRTGPRDSDPARVMAGGGHVTASLLVLVATFLCQAAVGMLY